MECSLYLFMLNANTRARPMAGLFSFGESHRIEHKGHQEKNRILLVPFVCFVVNRLA